MGNHQFCLLFNDTLFHSSCSYFFHYPIELLNFDLYVYRAWVALNICFYGPNYSIPLVKYSLQ